jgi:putative nucleotidyltransferase with HDIG domain
MSIPSRSEAAAILRGLEPNEKLMAHSTAVGEIAAFICAAMERRGVAVDTALAEAAALLHDLDKALPQGHPIRALGHGYGGAAWLTERGHAEIATAVRDHPVGRLAEVDSYAEYARKVGIEGCIVAYADKRALQDIVSLDARFDRWQRRYPDSETLPIARERALELEREVCEAAGLAPDEIERLPWVAAALREAA